MENRAVLAGIVGVGFGIMTWYVSGNETLQIAGVGNIPLHSSIVDLDRRAGIVYASTNQTTTPPIIKAFYLATMQQYGWTFAKTEAFDGSDALYFQHAHRSGWLKIEIRWSGALCGDSFTAISYQWLDAKPSVAVNFTPQSTPIIEMPAEYALADRASGGCSS